MSDAAAYTWQEATSLAGKTAVVTGVASGIGRATARQLAEAGVTVFGADRNTQGGEATLSAIRANGGKGEFLALDLTQADSIDSFVDSLKIKSGSATRG